MKGIFVLLLAGLSGVSLAEDQPFSFKEIPLNSNIEVANSYSQVLCKDMPEEKKIIGDKQCVYVKPGPYSQLNPKIGTFGAAAVNSIIMNYVGDTLKAMLVSVSPDDFTQIVDALKAKYGKPEILQSKGGATYENTILTWRRGASTLTARKYFGRVDTSLFKFEMDEYFDEVIRRRNERSKSGTSDL